MFILLFAACGAPEPAERAPEPTATGRTVGPLLEGDPPLACDPKSLEPVCVLRAPPGTPILAPFDGWLETPVAGPLDTPGNTLTLRDHKPLPVPTGGIILHLWHTGSEDVALRHVRRGEVIGHVGGSAKFWLAFLINTDPPVEAAYEAGRWPTGYPLPELRAD